MVRFDAWNVCIWTFEDFKNMLLLEKSVILIYIEFVSICITHIGPCWRMDPYWSYEWGTHGATVTLTHEYGVLMVPWGNSSPQ